MSEPGLRRWRLVTGLTSRAIVTINGAIVFDTADHPIKQMNNIFDYSFEAELAAGESVLNVGLFRFARMAQVGFRLEVTDSDVDAHVALSRALSAERRAHVEHELASIRLGRDVFYPEHSIGFNLGLAPGADTKLVVRLQAEAGAVVREVAPQAAGAITLCAGKDIEDGRYQMVCLWKDRMGKMVTSTEFAIHKVTPAPAMPGYERLAERKKVALEYAAANRQAASHAVIWPEAAKCAVGRYDEINENAIRESSSPRRMWHR